jgi:hypothetical protein
MTAASSTSYAVICERTENLPNLGNPRNPRNLRNLWNLWNLYSVRLLATGPKIHAIRMLSK